MHINDNIRAEIARRRTTAEAVRAGIRRDSGELGMAASTWGARMLKPRSWKLGELDDLAKFLGVDLSRLTG